MNVAKVAEKSLGGLKYCGLGFRCSNYLDELNKIKQGSKDIRQGILKEAYILLVNLEDFKNKRTVDILTEKDNFGINLFDYYKVFVYDYEHSKLNFDTYGNLVKAEERLNKAKITLEEILNGKFILFGSIDETISFFDDASNKCLSLNYSLNHTYRGF